MEADKKGRRGGGRKRRKRRANTKPRRRRRRRRLLCLFYWKTSVKSNTKHVRCKCLGLHTSGKRRIAVWKFGFYLSSFLFFLSSYYDKRRWRKKESCNSSK